MNLEWWNQKGYWLASLSNGHTIKELDLYDPKERVSPWFKLMKFLNERKDIYITNLRYCFRGRIYNLPSKSNKQFKFARGNTSKPRGYNFFVTAFSEAVQPEGVINNASAKRLEAHYDGFKICLYVDTNSGESWITVEDNNGSKAF